MRPMRPDWLMGTVLERRTGERVLFIRWDQERGRMVGGNWFVGVRIRPGISGNRKIGVVGNYDASGWKVIEEPSE